MLDISKAGVEILLRVQSRVAENCEDPDEYEQTDTVIEALKQMVSKTRLRKAITATAEGSADQIRREREVLIALTDTLVVKGMK
jgi:hypothetical protein